MDHTLDILGYVRFIHKDSWLRASFEISDEDAFMTQLRPTEYSVKIGIKYDQDPESNVTNISYTVRAFTPEMAIVEAGRRLGEKLKHAQIVSVSISSPRKVTLDVKAGS